MLKSCISGVLMTPYSVITLLLSDHSLVKIHFLDQMPTNNYLCENLEHRQLVSPNIIIYDCRKRGGGGVRHPTPYFESENQFMHELFYKPISFLQCRITYR